MWEKRLREWVDGYMFNKQYEECPYCQQERKKQWQGWHYKEKTHITTQTTYKDRALVNNGNPIEPAILRKCYKIGNDLYTFSTEECHT